MSPVPPKEKVARSNRVGNAIKTNKVAQIEQLFHLLNYYNRNLGFPVAKYCGECQKRIMMQIDARLILFTKNSYLVLQNKNYFKYVTHNRFI